MPTWSGHLLFHQILNVPVSVRHRKVHGFIVHFLSEFLWNKFLRTWTFLNQSPFAKDSYIYIWNNGSKLSTDGIRIRCQMNCLQHSVKHEVLWCKPSCPLVPYIAKGIYTGIELFVRLKLILKSKFGSFTWKVGPSAKSNSDTLISCIFWEPSILLFHIDNYKIIFKKSTVSSKS